MSNIKPKYSKDKNEIISAFSYPGGVYDKVMKHCPELRPVLDLLIRILILICQETNFEGIGLHYHSYKCFCLKRELWHVAEHYGYKHLFDKLGITYGKTCKALGFSGFHDASKGISAAFREGLIAHYINSENLVDPEYSLPLTINRSKNSTSYSLYITDKFQNSLLNSSYKCIAKNAALLFKGKILSKFNSKVHRSSLWNELINKAKDNGYRKTNNIDGSVKTDLVDTVSGIGISLKESDSSQLCSMSIEEVYTTFTYIKNKTNDPKLKDWINTFLGHYHYKNVCYKVFNEQIKIIKDNKTHKYHNLVMLYDEKHIKLTDELNQGFIDFPELQYELFRDAILGTSKFQEGSNAIPGLVFHFNSKYPDSFELLTPDEFLKKHMNDITMKITWKCSNTTSPSYTSLRLYFNSKHS